MIFCKLQLKVQLKTAVYPCMCSNSGAVLGKAWWVGWMGTTSLMFSPHFLKHPCYLLLSLFSCSVISDSLPPHGLQHARFPVLYHLLELAQIHAHWNSDAIQPSHPLLPPSPPTLNPSQHEGLFQWVGSLYQVAKVLELQFGSSSVPHDKITVWNKTK